MNTVSKRIAAIAMMAVLLFGAITCKKEQIDPPTVILYEDANLIEYTTATFSAEVTDQGGAEVKSRGFVYGKSGGKQDTVFCGKGLGVFSAELTGLESNAQYTYEAFARNAGGTGLSGKVTFTTLDQTLPKVITVACDSVTISTALCKGKVTDEVGSHVIKRGVCWSKDHKPTLDDFHVEDHGEGMGEYCCNITGLEPNTTYFVRAYATNSKGTGYGDKLEFKTQHVNAPTLTVSEGSHTTTTIKIKGEVTDNGGAGVIEQGVCWSQSTQEPTVYNHRQASADSTARFTVEIDSLTPGTSYHIRAYAKNKGGVVGYSDATITVTTDPEKPTVTTQLVSHTATTIKVKGKVTNTGGDPITERGVCWSHNSSEPTIGNHFKPSTDTTSSFYVTIDEGLQPGVVYHVRAYAKNRAGVGYGESVTDTTVTLLSVRATADPYVISRGEHSSLRAEADGGTGNYAYSWDHASTLSDADTDHPTASPTTTKIYTCTVYSGGQKATDTVKVSVVNKPTGFNAVAHGNMVSLGWTVADPADSYKVYKNGSFLKSVTSTACSDENLDPATYRYQVSTVYRGVESPKTDPVEVTVNSSLGVTATADHYVIKQGGSTKLNAQVHGGSGNPTYSWDHSSSLDHDNISSPTAKPTSTTTYRVTVHDDGQTDTDTVRVIVVKAPTNLHATVQGNSVHLTWDAANPATSYKVYRGSTVVASNVTSTSYTDNNLSPGTYKYKVTAVYQGVESPKSDEELATVYSSITVTVTANPSVIAQGSSTVLTANVTGGDGNYSYSWTPTSSLNNSHIQSPTATPTSTTTYTVNVSDGEGQSAQGQLEVNVVKAPTNLTAEVQNNNNVYLSWTAANPAQKYKVYRNNTLINSNVTTTHFTDSNLNPGNYTYQVSTVYNNVESPKSVAASATVYSSITVTVTANPSVTAQGSSTVLTANVTGGDGNYSYSWTPASSLNNSHIQSPTATPTSTTTYTVNVSDGEGQSAQGQLEVKVVKAPTNLQAEKQGNNVLLTWNLADPATSYKVYRNGSLVAQGVTTNHWDDNNLSSGTYSYQVKTVFDNVESPPSNIATVTVWHDGVLPGLFSVSAGQQVYFSQGNLQYIGSAGIPYWKFSENQWDNLGTTTGQNSSNQNVDRDLFGWGTSGYHDSSDPYNVNYQPWSTSSSIVNEDYNYFGYGPSTNMPSPNLTGSSAGYDWGSNVISNGGNQANSGWRTPTHNEWVYVFNTRSTPSGIRYAKAKVNNVNGVILLPDNWNSSNYTLSNTNQSGAIFSSNTITASQWETLEQHGAVFLPAVGCRYGTSVNDVGSYGYYWSASYYDTMNAWYVSFNVSYLYTDYYFNRSGGLSVRLVRSAQ